MWCTLPFFGMSSAMASTPPNFEQLIQACSEGDLSAVLKLIPTTDPRWFKSAALRTAADHNHTEIVLALLPYSDANAHDHHALKCAIGNHNDVLLDALLPLCENPFTQELYSVYATLHALWPEKLELFENTPIPQHQYDMILAAVCFDGTTPEHIMDLFSKTSVEAQKSAMIILLENRKYKLFDLVVAHSEPHNCVKAMHACFDHDYGRAKNLFQRCMASNVTIDMKDLRGIFEYSLDRLDWEVIHQVAPAVNWRSYSFIQHNIIEKVVKHNAVDVYTYFEQYFEQWGVKPSAQSAQISAQLGNQELTNLQINKNTVTTDVLDCICANGWSDTLSLALNCMDNDVLDALQHRLNARTGTRFAQCVRNQHYNCLAQILSHAFVTHKKTHTRAIDIWVLELVCQFSTDSLLFATVSQNISVKDVDQILDQAYHYFMKRPNERKQHVAVVEKFLPFASQKTRVHLFNLFVSDCTQTPQVTYAKKLAKTVAPYIKNQDVTRATQEWWDNYQAPKVNTKLSKAIGKCGTKGTARKM